VQKCSSFAGIVGENIMGKEKKERRGYERYKTSIDIHFRCIYDLTTKVEFELIDQKKGKAGSKKYPAVSRNVSAGGLCFVCDKELKQGDLLYIEVYLPSTKEVIPMRGEVRWCKPFSPSSDDVSQKENKQYAFQTGVKLISVKKELVDESIHHDKVYNVDWSIVLETIFGNYRVLMGGRYKNIKDQKQKE